MKTRIRKVEKVTEPDIFVRSFNPLHALISSLITVLVILGIYILLVASNFDFLLPPSLNPTRNQIISLIEDNSIYEAPNNSDIQKSELEAIVRALNDPYSGYLDNQDSDNFEDQLNQRYEGIGVRFDETPVGIVVDRVFRDSPAYSQGIKTGDQLLRVDGQDISSQPLGIIAEKIRGEEGTAVELVFAREEQEYLAKLTRSRIVTDLIYLDIYNDTAVIEITSFGEGLNSKMEKVTEQIISNSNINNVVIDVQGNSGGLLDQAIEVISYFVEPNTDLLIEKTKDGQEILRSKLKEPNLLEYNLAIVIDEYSASASEILAGALRDLRGAKILGTTSFGKGTVQRIYDLSNGDKLKLTVAEWFTPKGTKINQVGIEPDIFVARGQDPVQVAIDSFAN